MLILTGLLTTLSGLNLRNNPLEFPPAEVIERGTQTVLAFLREVLRAKSEGNFQAGNYTVTLSWETTAMRDHLSYKRTHTPSRRSYIPIQLNFPSKTIRLERSRFYV